MYKYFGDELLEHAFDCFCGLSKKITKIRIKLEQMNRNSVKFKNGSKKYRIR